MNLFDKIRNFLTIYTYLPHQSIKYEKRELNRHYGVFNEIY